MNIELSSILDNHRRDSQGFQASSASTNTQPDNHSYLSSRSSSSSSISHHPILSPSQQHNQPLRPKDDISMQLFSVHSRKAQTKAFVSFVLNSAPKVNSNQSTFEIDFQLYLTYPHKPLKEVPSGEYWVPDLFFLNVLTFEEKLDPDFSFDAQTHELTLVKHFLATFSFESNLSHFPFDCQILSVALRSQSVELCRKEAIFISRKSKEWLFGRALLAPSLIEPVPHEDPTPPSPSSSLFSPLSPFTPMTPAPHSTHSSSHSLPSVPPAAHPTAAAAHHTASPQITLEIPAARIPNFYLLNIVVPLFLITSACWGSFFIQESSFDTKLMMATLSFLSLAMFRSSISPLIPTIPYSNTLGNYFLVCYFFLFVVDILHIGVSSPGLADSAFARMNVLISVISYVLFACYTVYFGFKVLQQRRRFMGQWIQ